MAFYSSIEQTVKIELMDVSGKLINKKMITTEARSLTDINFNSPLPNGIYIVNVNSKTGNFSKKIILN